jgi:hypothetical protein
MSSKNSRITSIVEKDGSTVKHYQKRGNNEPFCFDISPLPEHFIPMPSGNLELKTDSYKES